MGGVKAIETVYKGFKFRSRLEARWAVFFDAMKWEWRYEPQGYEFDGERYLPDFWVPQLLSWVEVKGVLDAGEMQRLVKASIHLPRGGPTEEEVARRPMRGKLLILGEVPEPTRPWVFMQLGIDSLDEPTWRWGCLGVAGVFPYLDWNYVDPSDFKSMAAWAIVGRPASLQRPIDRVVNACFAARSARFEHGQKGAA